MGEGDKGISGLAHTNKAGMKWSHGRTGLLHPRQGQASLGEPSSFHPSSSGWCPKPVLALKMLSAHVRHIAALPQAEQWALAPCIGFHLCSLDDITEHPCEKPLGLGSRALSWVLDLCCIQLPLLSTLKIPVALQRLV